LEKMWEEAVEV